MRRNLTNPVLLEICVTSLDYARAAERGGASRIELCTNLDCGGVTPSIRLMQAARKALRIPIHVLIRPRPGNFVYSAREFLTMRQAIQNAKDLKMDGIVLGILDQNSRIDIPRTRQLVELAHPLPVTFHRAFDETASPQASLEAVIQSGAKRLLTSGGSLRGPERFSTLRRLVEKAGDRLRVMPGGGIKPANVMRIIRATGAREVHASLLTSALRKPTDGQDRKSQVEKYYRRVLRVASILGSMTSR